MQKWPRETVSQTVALGKGALAGPPNKDPCRRAVAGGGGGGGGGEGLLRPAEVLPLFQGIQFPAVIGVPVPLKDILELVPKGGLIPSLHVALIHDQGGPGCVDKIVPRPVGCSWRKNTMESSRG